VGEAKGAAHVGSGVVGVGTEVVGEAASSVIVGADDCDEAPMRVVSPVAAV
jgi:hypothetical protein